MQSVQRFDLIVTGLTDADAKVTIGLLQAHGATKQGDLIVRPQQSADIYTRTGGRDAQTIHRTAGRRFERSA